MRQGRIPKPVAYWGALMDGETAILEGEGEGGDAPYNATTWTRFEAHAGGSPGIVHFSDPWLTWDGYGAGSSAAVNAKGAIVMKTLGSTLAQLNEVAEGKQDAAITAWAEAAAAYGKPVFLRLWWEANGTWWPFSRAANYVAAWRRFYDKVVAKASNVAFVYCPNRIFDGPTEEFLISMFPGNAYVDWVGIDGYSGQNPYKKEGTKNPIEVFLPTYSKLRELAPTKPVIICETATSEIGTNKPVWISELFGAPFRTAMPKMRGIVWFNDYIEHTSEAGSGRVDWPIESSSAARAAFAAAIAQPSYIGAGHVYGREKPPVPGDEI